MYAAALCRHIGLIANIIAQTAMLKKDCPLLSEKNEQQNFSQEVKPVGKNCLMAVPRGLLPRLCLPISMSIAAIDRCAKKGT